MSRSLSTGVRILGACRFQRVRGLALDVVSGAR